MSRSARGRASGVRRVTGGQRGSKRGTRRQRNAKTIDRAMPKRHAPAVAKSAILPKTTLDLPEPGHIEFDRPVKTTFAPANSMRQSVSLFVARPGFRTGAARPIVRHCDHCNVLFAAPHGNVKFCTEACRAQTDKQNRRVRYRTKYTKRLDSGARQVRPHTGIMAMKMPPDVCARERHRRDRMRKTVARRWKLVFTGRRNAIRDRGMILV